MKTVSQEDSITVTSKATRLLTDHFKDKVRQPIRLFVCLGGCGIRTFGIAIEQPKPSDQVFEIDGFTYIINQKVLSMVQPITVDSDGIGFRISGRGVPPPHGCGTCGSMCGISGSNRCPADCSTCQIQCSHSKKF